MESGAWAIAGDREAGKRQRSDLADVGQLAEEVVDVRRGAITVDPHRPDELRDHAR